MSSIVTLGYSKGPLLVPLGYGGGININPSSQSGEDSINVLSGTRVFGFGTLTVNGKVVTSPVTLVEEGYYVVQASGGGVVGTLRIAVINPATTIVKIIDVIGPTSTTSAYQNMTNSLVQPLSSFPNSRAATVNAECRVLVSTNKAVHVSIRHVNDDGSQTEISKVSATANGRWISPGVMFPQDLNNAKLVLPINTGDQIIGSLMSVSSPGAPVTPTTNPVVLLPNGLSIQDDQEFVPSSGSIPNSFNLVNENSPDGDTTYVLMSETQQLGSWGLPAYSPSVGLKFIYSVKITAVARRDSGPRNAVLWGAYLKNGFTGVRYLPGMVIETAGGYITHTVELFTNPFTNQPWGVGDLQSGYLRLGCQRDVNLDAIRVTQVHLTVDEVL